MDSKTYLKEQGLGFLLELGDKTDYTPGVFDAVSGDLSVPFKMQHDDLARLHKLVRARKAFTILEFGLGFSTIVMAHALYLNKQDWDKLENKPAVRNRFMFKLFTVDTSEKWIAHTQQNFPEELKPYVAFHHSGVSIGTYNGQLCHYYDHLPDVIADFIYLDGPHPKEVKGQINGLSFNCDERTVIGADLLLMESTFLPGTFITIDGRTNNARFLQRNFQRKYKIEWDKATDTTSFELDEERLGKYNILGSDFLK
jgi:hypothetical protein